MTTLNRHTIESFAELQDWMTSSAASEEHYHAEERDGTPFVIYADDDGDYQQLVPDRTPQGRPICEPLEARMEFPFTLLIPVELDPEPDFPDGPFSLRDDAESVAVIVGGWVDRAHEEARDLPPAVGPDSVHARALHMAALDYGQKAWQNMRHAVTRLS